MGFAGPGRMGFAGPGRMAFAGPGRIGIAGPGRFAWVGGPWLGLGAGGALAAARPYYGGYGYGDDSCVQLVPNYGWVNVCNW